MTPRPSHPNIEVGMQAALDVTRPMQPYQKHALSRALAMHMPDAADLLFAILDVETGLPCSEDFDASLDELDKIVGAYLARGRELADEARGADPYDYRYQERREATDQ